MKSTARFRIWALSMAGLSWLLSACGPQLDLQTVQKYAQTTTDASASFAALSNDYGPACDGLAELQLPPPLWPYPLASPTPLPAGTSAALPATAATSPSATMSLDVWKLAQAPNPQACQAGHDIGTQWAERNDIIIGYVHSLAAIAGVDVKPSFAPLTDALVQGNVITSAQDSAFSALTDAISGIVIGNEVQAELTKTIKAANAPLKNSIAALQVVNQSYGILLTSEFQQTRLYYQRLIGTECNMAATQPLKAPSIGAINNACRKLQATSPILADRVFLQRQRLNESLAALNQKLSASATYVQVINEIETTHQKLYDRATSSATLQDYITILQTDVIPLYQDVETLRKATQ